MAISATDVKALRDRTSAPFGDCKAALEKANGDMEKAIQILRENIKGLQVKKGDRETAEGRIGSFIDPDQGVAALVEMRCESAPVVKSEHFIALATDLAKQVALKNPANVEELLAQPFVGNPGQTVNDRIGEVVALIRENMKPARFVRLSGGHFGAYVHHDGSVGVLVQAQGAKGDTQALRDVAMHTTAKNPVAARREDVAADIIEKEREIARNQAAATGKAAQLVDKIAEGKLKTWFGENVLVEQPFVKDDSKTVGDVLKNVGLQLTTFARLKVGELSK
jgi:elongation factor Ts